MKFIFVFLFVFTPILSLLASKDNLLNENNTVKTPKVFTKDIKKKKKDDFTYWYYKPDKIGARAFQNPLQFIIEGGIPRDKILGDTKFGYGIFEVLKKLKKTILLINKYSWKKLIYHEFIPLFKTPFNLNWISGVRITSPGFSYEYKKDNHFSFGFGLSVNKISMNSRGELILGATVLYYWVLLFYY